MTAAVMEMGYLKKDGLPWHGLGTPLTGDETFDEMFEKCGLDFDVTLREMHVVGDTDLVVPGFAVCRTTKAGDKKILATVGDKYRVLQNKDAWEFFRPFIESGECRFTTAGSLFDGGRVWAQVQLNRDNAVVVDGDEIEKKLLLSHSHDGSLAINVGFTPIRVVCANTEQMARNEMLRGGNRLAKIRHTESAKVRLDKIRDTIAEINALFDNTVSEVYRKLARTPIKSGESLNAFFMRVFDMEVNAETGKLATRTQNRLNRLVELFETGKGNTLPGVAGTVWAAYNAVTEYLSYDSGRSNDNRMNSLWFGVNGTVNYKALETALALAV